MYVSPATLSVVSVYLADNTLDVLRATSPLAGSTSAQPHFMLRNLVQIGDVLLVHDEKVGAHAGLV